MMDSEDREHIAFSCFAACDLKLKLRPRFIIDVIWFLQNMSEVHSPALWPKLTHILNAP